MPTHSMHTHSKWKCLMQSVGKEESSPRFSGLSLRILINHWHVWSISLPSRSTKCRGNSQLVVHASESSRRISVEWFYGVLYHQRDPKPDCEHRSSSKRRLAANHEVTKTSKTASHWAALTRILLRALPTRMQVTMPQPKCRKDAVVNENLRSIIENSFYTSSTHSCKASTCIHAVRARRHICQPIASSSKCWDPWKVSWSDGERRLSKFSSQRNSALLSLLI